MDTAEELYNKQKFKTNLGKLCFSGFCLKLEFKVSHPAPKTCLLCGCNKLTFEAERKCQQLITIYTNINYYHSTGKELMRD